MGGPAPPALTVETTDLPGVVLITPKRHSDKRGHFLEAYSQDAFRQAGINCLFVQDNQSLSYRKGTIRGLHFQIPPFAQAKLVRVLRGAIYDVAVDIRSGRASRGRWAGAVLSAENGAQLFVPPGFAHGFCTLESNTEVLYKVDASYSREHERGLLWNDPDVGIAWPPEADPASLLERDGRWPVLRGLPDHF